MKTCIEFDERTKTVTFRRGKFVREMKLSAKGFRWFIQGIKAVLKR